MLQTRPLLLLLLPLLLLVLLLDLLLLLHWRRQPRQLGLMALCNKVLKCCKETVALLAAQAINITTSGSSASGIWGALSLAARCWGCSGTSRGTSGALCCCCC
jgi:hypothetical protein